MSDDSTAAAEDGEGKAFMTATEATSKIKVITQNTLIPIGTAIGAALFFLGVVNYLDARFSAAATELAMLKDQLRNMDYNINGQLKTIRVLNSDRWTARDMKVWEQDLKIRNPTLNIPDSHTVVQMREASDRAAAGGTP